MTVEQLAQDLVAALERIADTLEQILNVLRTHDWGRVP